MPRLNIIFRVGRADADGRCVGFEYHTHEINIPENSALFEELGMYPEVFGGEWLRTYSHDDGDKD